MNNKGFTLIELLVVVLIIGILAAMALPQYFRAVERSRMAEAVTLLTNIAQSQQRKWLQIERYTTNLDAVDVVPSGATGPSFYTKKPGGTPATNAQGFLIELNQTLDDVSKYAGGSATALRVTGTDSSVPQYRYKLYKYYAGQSITCEGFDDNLEGRQLCMDFCGVEELTDNMCCSSGKDSRCLARE